MIGFFVLGMIPALRILWDASLLALGTTAAYLALLIHFHRRAVERDSKIVDIEDRRGDSRPRLPLVATPVADREDEDGDAAWARGELDGLAFEDGLDEIVAGSR